MDGYDDENGVYSSLTKGQKMTDKKVSEDTSQPAPQLGTCDAGGKPHIKGSLCGENWKPVAESVAQPQPEPDMVTIVDIVRRELGRFSDDLMPHEIDSIIEAIRASSVYEGLAEDGLCDHGVPYEKAIQVGCKACWHAALDESMEQMRSGLVAHVECGAPLSGHDCDICKEIRKLVAPQPLSAPQWLVEDLFQSLMCMVTCADDGVQPRDALVYAKESIANYKKFRDEGVAAEPLSATPEPSNKPIDWSKSMWCATGHHGNCQGSNRLWWECKCECHAPLSVNPDAIPVCRNCHQPSPWGDPCEKCQAAEPRCTVVGCGQVQSGSNHSSVDTPYTHKFAAPLSATAQPPADKDVYALAESFFSRDEWDGAEPFVIAVAFWKEMRVAVASPSSEVTSQPTKGNSPSLPNASVKS